jgi:exodeoxyribonuclease VII large subunit
MPENFFDFREKLSRKREPAPSPKVDAPAKNAPDALTVSQLTAQIERALKAGIPATVHVKGEVSNLNLHRGSGHLYFTLKDATACIDCVMFRSDVARLKFMPEDGIELLATGRIAVYPQRGRYQLYATSLHPLGHGALELAFKQLCERLNKEGLFNAERKKPLPQYPMTIALVTSRSTAALQDMLKVLRRFPWVRLYLCHVPVQGDGAAELIAQALRDLNQGARGKGQGASVRPANLPLATCPSPLPIDLILLARGGGSLEDLWEFNEEIVARAIAASKIPVITGIGHEVDVSIADLVADYHAHTPTEAAQVAMANWRIAGDIIHTSGVRLARGLRGVVQDAKNRLLHVERHEFFRRPTDRINQLRQFLDDRQRSLQLAVAERLRVATARFSRLEALLVECHPRHVVQLKRQRLEDLSKRLSLAASHDLKTRDQRVTSLQRHLDAISPQSVLKRGYTITTRKKDGAIIRSSKDPRVGERILTQFADGTVESMVEDQKQLPLFE